MNWPLPFPSSFVLFESGGPVCRWLVHTKPFSFWDWQATGQDPHTIKAKVSEGLGVLDAEDRTREKPVTAINKIRLFIGKKKNRTRPGGLLFPAQ